MVLALFDYVDTICSEQFHKETVYYKIKIFSKGQASSHKLTPEYIYY